MSWHRGSARNYMTYVRVGTAGLRKFTFSFFQRKCFDKW